jgi:hypothetical protein
MKKYLVLYRAEGALSGMSVAEMFANSTTEQMAAGMAAWKAWYEGTRGAVVDLGAPLDKSTSLSGGSHAPEKTAITGYSILQAESIDEAVALLEGHPHFHMPGSSVQVLECFPLPGM